MSNNYIEIYRPELNRGERPMGERPMRSGKIMTKIIVIGSPGSGKSSFSRGLRDALGIPLYYLDMVWHKPDGTNVPREEFDARLEEILKTGRWIIDGNYQRTLETRLEKCDTVFLMDFPVEVCIAGAQSRIGKEREDLPWIETEFDKEFRQWIIDFPKESLPKIYEMLEKYREGREIVVFKSRAQADDFLKKLPGVNAVTFFADEKRCVRSK